VCRFDRAPLHILEHSGAIHIKGSDLMLPAAMPKLEFLDSDLYQHTQSAGYCPLHNCTGHGFLVSFHDAVFENVYLRLSFENDRLGIVDFGWGPHITTPEWTEARIQADVARYRTFLMQELGPIESFPHDFPWGKVYAAKDAKAGTPATGIRYTALSFARGTGEFPTQLQENQAQCPATDNWQLSYSGTLCSSLCDRMTRSSEYGARRVGSW